MNRKQADNLKILGDFLYNLNPEQFEIDSWTRDDSVCGTIHCAGGWAGTIPELKSQGLILNENEHPSFNGLVGFDAIKLFFGLSDLECYSIFSRDFYHSKNVDVSECLRRISWAINSYFNDIIIIRW